jgi:hypothetical protein
MADPRAISAPCLAMCTSAPLAGSRGLPTRSASGSRCLVAGDPPDRFRIPRRRRKRTRHPAFTTIAWRLWHLIGCYGAKRNSEWLGIERRSGRFGGCHPAAATAAPAIATLERAHAFWQELLYALPADSRWHKMGAIAGPFAEHDGPRWCFISSTGPAVRHRRDRVTLLPL